MNLCPKHNRPFVRGICGPCRIESRHKPAQAPPVAVAMIEPQAAPMSAPIPISKKRGRPPKHGTAMTPAERKVASRASQKAKQDDAERRNLIAEIVKIVRRNLAGPGDVGRNSTVTANRNYVRILHDDLFHLSIDKLQMSLEALKLPDSRGRLHNERSG